MIKKVLLKPRFRGWALHSLYNELVECPPQGFTILYEESGGKSSFHKIDNKSSKPIFKELFYQLKPIPYLIAQKYEKQNFSYYDIIYASQHVIFNSNKPWLVDLEFANALAAYGNLSIIKNNIQNRLKEKNCKFILPWSDWAKETLLLSLDCKDFKDKIRVIHYTIKSKIVKKENHDKIVLLFVGSSNPMNAYNIQFKNLKEVILAFQKISEKYDNLELIIRSYLNPELRYLINKSKNILLIDSFLSRKELDDLYQIADIFVLPSHETCGISLLDAMSFGLPVISMNLYDIPEVIINMKNGILIDPPKDMRYYTKTKNPFDYSRKFMAGMKKNSCYMVEQLEKAYILLIENTSLRDKLGKEAKYTIDKGELSLEKRNEKLRVVLDEST